MKDNGSSTSLSPSPSSDGITKIIVGGFKSLAGEHSVEIRPLTVLAGANSSGKSSIMQPLLLLKQTLEASYDPGALLLDGANLRVTSADQLFSRLGVSELEHEIQIGFEIGGMVRISTVLQRVQRGQIDIQRTIYSTKNRQLVLRKNMKSNEIDELFVGTPIHQLVKTFSYDILRQRCFLTVVLPKQASLTFFLTSLLLGDTEPSRSIFMDAERYLTDIVHIPGLRGNPVRTYPVTAVESSFPGTFEKYTASIINAWQHTPKDNILRNLNKDLKTLGLTWKVSARLLNDAQVELQVGRLPERGQGSPRDLVSIADVGFGVSQTLPILVALHIARPGQLVYIEQPELHLHPRAQTAMAKVLINAARRGVRVVAETHSDLLLLAIQTEVAKGLLPADSVILHWFSRVKDGTTKITSADLDESGTFGDWPEDFSDERLKAERDFLDSASVPIVRK
jgi:predicted ATPase